MEAINQPAQPPRDPGFGKGGMKASLRVAVKPGHTGYEPLQSKHMDACILLVLGQISMPNCCDTDEMTPLGQLLTEQLYLQLGSANERRIKVIRE
jgi:hypothetical protein